MPTVLVVDDSATDRRMATLLLEKNPHIHVISAVDGEDALEQIESHLPDLVVTDLMMPRLNGLQLVEAIRQDYPLLPVILMTAAGSEEIACEALQKGAASYVPKKALGTELGEVAERVLANSREERSQSRLLNRLQYLEFRFEIETELSLLLALAAHLRQSVMQHRICSPSDAVRVGIALEEALTNAYYHGNLEVSSELREKDYRLYYDTAQQRTTEEPYCRRRIQAHSKITPFAAEFTITDDGPGFDRSALPDPTDPKNLERPSGRGLLLMQTFMDEVRFNDAGNQVTLVKRRSAALEDD